MELEELPTSKKVFKQQGWGRLFESTILTIQISLENLQTPGNLKKQKECIALM